MGGGRCREDDLVRRIRGRAVRTLHGGVVAGVGDDAAVLSPSAGTEAVATVDAMVEGVHFERRWGRPEDLGAKAAAAALSDLAAMGAEARAILAFLAIPRGIEGIYIDWVLEGLAAEAETAGAALVGGDTTASPGPVVLSITALGEVPAGAAIRRAGARPGDAVFVTGALGGAAAGLESLRRGLGAVAAEARFLRPQARLAEGLALRGVATAAIDVSDGLARDLGRLAEESGVGIEIETDRIPLGPAASLEDALHGGEDYELAFTAPAGAAPPAGVAATRIGRVVEGPGLILATPDGRRRIEPHGYDHFA